MRRVASFSELSPTFAFVSPVFTTTLAFPLSKPYSRIQHLMDMYVLWTTTVEFI